MAKLKSSTKQELIEALKSIPSAILGVIVFLFSFVGVVAYFLKYMPSLRSLDASKAIPPSPIELAGISATIGGLILIGAFYKESKDGEDTGQGSLLKLTAKLFLGAAISFVIMFLSLEYLSILPAEEKLSFMNWVAVIVVDISMAIGGFTLSIGLSILAVILPSLGKSKLDKKE